jgi:hypothetical protein
MRAELSVAMAIDSGAGLERTLFRWVASGTGRADAGHMRPAEKRPGGPRLLDQVRRELRLRHYSPRTEEAYVGWVKRYHGLKHPGDLGQDAISAFLTYLANDESVSASTQNQALAALLFMYRHVLRRSPEELGDFVHAKRPALLPVVLSVSEVALVLEHMEGVPRLMASLLYGSAERPSTLNADTRGYSRLRR